MEKIIYKSGLKVLFNNNPAIIIKVIDLNLISIQMLESNIIHTVNANLIDTINQETDNTKNRPHDSLTDKEWKKAKKRYDIIEPILEKKTTTDELKKIADINNIHYTTLYRWINKFKEYGTIASLIGSKKLGGKNKSRLNSKLDEIINKAISEVYLTPTKKSIPKVIRTVEMKCRELNIKSPHPNTIRNRIKNLSEEEVLKSRYGYKKSRDKFEPHKGHFPGANYPLSIVQIDHTCVDIILVDEHYRKPFKRPYLTLAIDVFSRMVIGFNLSFDPPGEMGTGLCIANSILSKELLLEKHNIKGDWPCWGTMSTISLDNAKEFRGNMLKRACKNYGINIEHRPVATPHWGGHVERLLGTFTKEIHNLAGTTFSKIEDRENYDSIKKASLTINEFEKWLITYIVNVYHIRIHSSLGMSPIDKYRQGIFGENGADGTGIPPKLLNERRVKLDFMPFFERTIQEYGVVIGHIYYYGETLRKYIHSKEDKSKYSKKRKFIFKRDPRDISIIYFYDPELNEYFEIPYRDTSKPPMSIWEFNEVISNLKKSNTPIEEDTIFEAYKNMEEIELKAIRETKRLKRFSRYSDKRNEGIHKNLKPKIKTPKEEMKEIPQIDILPFEDIDDEAFT